MSTPALLHAGLRIGLTGGLASGKSTIARMFAALGVHTISADEIGRELMSPRTAVFGAIVDKFGRAILRPDGTIDRQALARLAFDEHRLEDLNRIVHPAVIAAQEQWAREIFAREPGALVMVESALIFEVDLGEIDRGMQNTPPATHNTGWRQRFDKIILVTVPDEQKIARYMARVSPGRWDEAVDADARRRLAAQIPDNEKIARSDYVIQNTGAIEEVRDRVKEVFLSLRQFAPSTAHAEQVPRASNLDEVSLE